MVFQPKKLIKTYLPKVVGKEWLNVSNDKISVASYLTSIGKEDVCDFNIRMIYEADRPDME